MPSALTSMIVALLLTDALAITFPVVQPQLGEVEAQHSHHSKGKTLLEAGLHRMAVARSVESAMPSALSQLAMLQEEERATDGATPPPPMGVDVPMPLKLWRTGSKGAEQTVPEKKPLARSTAPREPGQTMIDRLKHLIAVDSKLDWQPIDLGSLRQRVHDIVLNSRLAMVTIMIVALLFVQRSLATLHGRCTKKAVQKSVLEESWEQKPISEDNPNVNHLVASMTEACNSMTSLVQEASVVHVGKAVESLLANAQSSGAALVGDLTIMLDSSLNAEPEKDAKSQHCSNYMYMDHDQGALLLFTQKPEANDTHTTGDADISARSADGPLPKSLTCPKASIDAKKDTATGTMPSGRLHYQRAGVASAMKMVALNAAQMEAHAAVDLETYCATYDERTAAMQRAATESSPVPEQVITMETFQDLKRHHAKNEFLRFQCKSNEHEELLSAQWTHFYDKSEEFGREMVAKNFNLPRDMHKLRTVVWQNWQTLKSWPEEGKGTDRWWSELFKLVAVLRAVPHLLPLRQQHTEALATKDPMKLMEIYFGTTSNCLRKTIYAQLLWATVYTQMSLRATGTVVRWN